MANEQIIQNGLIVGRAAGAAITVVPTEDSTSTILFDDRSGGQTSEIKFDHLTDIYTITIGSIAQFQVTSTNVTIAGDLIVNGTTTTINATNLEIVDNVIVVNSSEAGAGVTAGIAGIEIERGSLTNTSWIFDEANDWWSPSGVTQIIGNIATIDSSLATEQVLTIASTGAILLPSGTTGERPATPSAGMFRYNTSLSQPEVYSSSAWNNITSTSALITQRGYINGLILSNGTDALKDIDIAIGIAKDDSDTDNMELTGVLVKQLDASWAVGTNAGGLDGTESVAGTPDADTWYHAWLIRRSDTGVVDVLFSESATAPTMPTNYDQKRRIGAVLTDATPDIIAFHQYGDYFYWDTLLQDFTQTTTPITASLKTMAVPTGIQVTGLFQFGLNISGSANNQYILITSPDQADLAATTAFYTIVNSGNDTSDAIFISLRTNTSSQIRVRAQTASGSRTFQGMTYGWIDPRGKNE